MAVTASPAGLDLDTAYELTPEQIRQFREEGFIKLKDVFDGPTLEHYGEEISRLAFAGASDKPLDQRDTYGKAFIQVGNLWEKSEVAREFAFSKRLARLATELMGTDGVRVWHDQALYKEPSGGFTPWHVDQQYWPMASAKSVTAWIPLHAVPINMGALCFGKGSHVKNIGRDLEISDESEQRIRDAVKREGLIEVHEPFDLGEVSFHYGWTLHRAGPNTTRSPRKVFTVIYMDQDMRLAQPRNENQQRDWNTWTPSTKVGEVMDDDRNPILYSSRS